MKKQKNALPGIKANQNFSVGAKVKAKQSNWTGIITGVNKKNPSSPFVVKWDKNGNESNENAMSIEVVSI